MILGLDVWVLDVLGHIGYLCLALIINDNIPDDGSLWLLPLEKWHEKS